MHVIQYDRQYRIPYADSTTGWYYTTNTWYYDLDNPGGPTSSVFQIGRASTYGRLPFVQTSAYRMTDPPHSGIVVDGGPTLHQPGAAPFGGPCPIGNIARLNFYSDGVYVGYKLWRMPVPPEHIENGLLSSAVHNWLQVTMCAPLYLAKICTSAGLPINDIRVSRRVHLWGIRMGTKRRSQPVLPWS